MTAALTEDPIFSGLFAKIDKDAAKELESEFRESIKNPETLEKSVGDFVQNKLQTQCKAFTYVGLTAENKSLQQEIERLKAQLAIISRAFKNLCQLILARYLRRHPSAHQSESPVETM